MSKSQTFYYDEKTDEFIPEYEFPNAKRRDDASGNSVTISIDVDGLVRYGISVDGLGDLIAAVNRLIYRYNEGNFGFPCCH